MGGIEITMDCDEKERKLDKGILILDKFGELLWELCPLNRNHYCRKNAMKEHLESCKLSLRELRKVECPFNALHIVNLMEIEQHVMTCEFRVTQTNSLFDIIPKQELIPGVKQEPMNVALDVPNTWEDGQNPETGYDPEVGTRFSLVLRPPKPGWSKAKKKAWRASEQERFASLGCPRKEKPRATPYHTENQIKNARAMSRQVAAAKTEADLIGVIDSLGSANIADPRDSIMKRITARMKVVQLLEDKLRDEKMALKKVVEEYLAFIGESGDDQQRGKRRGSNLDPRITEAKRKASEGNPHCLPDIMTSAMNR